MKGARRVSGAGTVPPPPPPFHVRAFSIQRTRLSRSLEKPRATLGTRKSDPYREVGVLVRFKQESMYGLSAEKSRHCREVAVGGLY